MNTSLISYLTAAAIAWGGYHKNKDFNVNETIAKEVAEAITIILDEEEPLFSNDIHKTKTALLLLSTAFNESRFHQFVDEGLCNEKDFKADGRGDCDHGRAYTVWQINMPKAGIDLTNNGWKVGGIITGRDLLNSKELAVRTALHMLRQSYKSFGSFCGYSGESCDEGKHPHAENYKGLAILWYKKHGEPK